MAAERQRRKVHPHTASETVLGSSPRTDPVQQ